MLDAAASLFAERGFTSVRLEDLGAAVGVSGPAVYRHFPNKEAVLVELMVGISEYLLDGGRAAVDRGEVAVDTLSALVEFHLDFAFDTPVFIRSQDRDLQSLPEGARRKVRRMQREYVELWVGVLCAVGPELSEADARTTAHAVFDCTYTDACSDEAGSTDRASQERSARNQPGQLVRRVACRGRLVQLFEALPRG